MFLDPLTLGHPSGIPTAWAGTNTDETFRRVGNGKYISVTGLGSLDQPARLTMKPNVRLSGPSRYSLRLERDKNVSPVNGVQQADDTIFCEIIIGGNYRTFTQQDFLLVLNAAYGCMSNNIARVVAGES